MKTTLTAVALVAFMCAAACGRDTPTGPNAADLTGSWTGTSTYPNSPFHLTLTQTGETVRGQYRDTLDSSIAVTGTFTRPVVTIVVDFGDAKLNLKGTVLSPRIADGVMYTSALGNREYPFRMTR